MVNKTCGKDCFNLWMNLSIGDCYNKWPILILVNNLIKGFVANIFNANKHNHPIAKDSLKLSSLINNNNIGLNPKFLTQNPP